MESSCLFKRILDCSDVCELVDSSLTEARKYALRLIVIEFLDGFMNDRNSFTDLENKLESLAQKSIVAEHWINKPRVRGPPLRVSVSGWGKGIYGKKIFAKISRENF